MSRWSVSRGPAIRRKYLIGGAKLVTLRVCDGYGEGTMTRSMRKWHARHSRYTLDRLNLEGTAS